MEISIAEANAIIQEKKIAVKPIEWVEKVGKANPRWIEYVSACQIQSEIREDVMFRAQYRAEKFTQKGVALIQMPEMFNAAICVANFRIIAIDTTSKHHRNDIGKGLPFHGKTIKSRTHIHIWTGKYGYAEPFEKELNDLELLIEEFTKIANLSLIGKFTHPMKGITGDLPI
jgi:hypothetical protein